MSSRYGRWFRRESQLGSEPADKRFFGVDDSECAVGGNKADPSKMPIPAPAGRRRPLLVAPRIDQMKKSNDGEESHLYPHLQGQSAFFSRLPLEIRREIYTLLFGGRRIHIEYDYHYQVVHDRIRDRMKVKLGEAFLPKREWRWWHWICDGEEGSFPGDDKCRRTEHYDPKRWKIKGKDRPWIQHKMTAVIKWLRSCRLGYVPV